MRPVDGRLVLLGLIVVIAFFVARDMEPDRPASLVARERAADVVLVEVDRTQQCYFRRRERYAESVPSLQFAGGHFMRTALRHGFNIHLRADGDAYVQRITGEGIDMTLERRGADLVRLEVGDRPAPQLAAGC
jgi:biopolymer transport protein ExbD